MKVPIIYNMYNDYFYLLRTPPYNYPGYTTAHYIIIYTMRFQVITLHYDLQL